MADTPDNACWLALKGRLTDLTFPAPCPEFLWPHAVKVFTGWPILAQTVGGTVSASDGFNMLCKSLTGPVPPEPVFFSSFLHALWPAA